VGNNGNNDEVWSMVSLAVREVREATAVPAWATESRSGAGSGELGFLTTGM
jgi:hypothetical protein